MSYGFNFQAASKEDAKTQIAAKLDEVVQGQPIHAADRDAAQAAAGAFLDTLTDVREDQVIDVRVSGSVGWNNDKAITSAALQVSVGLLPRT